MLENVKVGIAPLSWTNDDDPNLGGETPFEQCIQEMYDSGYVGCEVGNKFPRDPKVLHAALDPLNLQVASAWFSTFFTVPEQKDKTINDFIKHMNFLKAMGAKVIVVCECGHSIQGTNEPIFGNKPIFSDDQWHALISGLHQLGKLANEHDMQIVYHEHMGTGVQTADELEYLMKNTNPELVSLLVDTGHITYAGGDPVAIINQYNQRIKHVHLKDLRKDILDKTNKDKLCFMDAVRQGVFTVPGDGFINYKPIFQALADHNYHGWFIVEAEQDPSKANPLEYATKGREYINKLTGL